MPAVHRTRQLLFIGPDATGAADQLQRFRHPAIKLFPTRYLLWSKLQRLIRNLKGQRRRDENESQHLGNLIAPIAGRLRGEVAVLIFLRRDINQFSRHHVIIATARAQRRENQHWVTK